MSRSGTTANSVELRRIRRLLSARKPLSPTQGRNLVAALRALRDDLDGFTMFGDLTQPVIARVCASAEQHDPATARALLTHIVALPTILLEGVIALARCAARAAEAPDLARRICAEAVKSHKISLAFAKAAADAFSFEPDASSTRPRLALFSSLLLGLDEEGLEEARAQRLPIGLELRCYSSELARAVHESVGDDRWAREIVLDGVRETLSLPQRPVANLYHLVVFAREALGDAALSADICHQAERAASTFQDRADLFLIVFYALQDTPWGKRAFDDCARRAEAWQEHLWLADFLTQGGDRVPLADGFFDAALSAAQGSRAAVRIVAESIERVDPERACEILDQLDQQEVGDDPP